MVLLLLPIDVSALPIREKAALNLSRSFTSGPAAGKVMIVQATNTGGDVGGVSGPDVWTRRT